MFETSIRVHQELNVSFVGYHTSTQTITLKENLSPITVHFNLDIDEIELYDVVISADNSEWFEKYETFRRKFIGTNQFARETKILKRWIIDFVKNPDV